MSRSDVYSLPETIEGTLQSFLLTWEILCGEKLKKSTEKHHPHYKTSRLHHVREMLYVFSVDSGMLVWDNRKRYGAMYWEILLQHTDPKVTAYVRIAQLRHWLARVCASCTEAAVLDAVVQGLIPILGHLLLVFPFAILTSFCPFTAQ